MPALQSTSVFLANSNLALDFFFREQHCPHDSFPVSIHRTHLLQVSVGSLMQEMYFELVNILNTR